MKFLGIVGLGVLAGVAFGLVQLGITAAVLEFDPAGLLVHPLTKRINAIFFRKFRHHDLFKWRMRILPHALVSAYVCRSRIVGGNVPWQAHARAGDFNFLGVAKFAQKCSERRGRQSGRELLAQHRDLDAGRLRRFAMKACQRIDHALRDYVDGRARECYSQLLADDRDRGRLFERRRAFRGQIKRALELHEIDAGRRACE